MRSPLLIAFLSVSSFVIAGSKLDSTALLLHRAATLSYEGSEEYPVAGVALTRDAAVFSLTRGSMLFVRDHTGRIRAAAFAGKATFTLLPPTTVEREHLARSMGDTVLRMNATSVFLLFADSTDVELRSALGESKGAPSAPVRDVVKKALKHIGKDGRLEDPSFIKLMLERRSGANFLAYVVPERGDPIVFGIDPHLEEEVYLTRETGGLFSVWPERDLICSFHRAADYALPEDDRLQVLRRFRLDRLVLDGTFETQTFSSDLTFRATANLTMRSSMGKQRWMYFFLDPELAVDSVTLTDGRPLRWHRDEDDYLLWVEADADLSVMSQRTIHVVYHGDIIKRNDLGMTVLKTSWWWFPRHDASDLTSTDLTFHVPEEFTLASVGDRMSDTTAEGVTTTRWVSGRPISNIAFNVGQFKVQTIRDARIPPVTIFMSSIARSELTGSLLRQGVLSADMEDAVGADIANSILVFQRLFGPLTTKQLCATEIAEDHGEAFPGLLHLSWATFQLANSKGLHEVFRAHEVAHQWWGIGVTPRTYHDTWLAEGMSDFSALWYLQTIDGKGDRYFGILNGWKDRILSNRSYLFGKEQEEAPIWLGYRTETSSTRGDYTVVVYKKAAWVLHMLRILLLDLQTMRDDTFQAGLKEFYTRYAGKTAGSTEFRQTMEKASGRDLGWFFDEWVMHSTIPRYRFAFTLATAPGGGHIVRCRVRQDGVPTSFRMPAIIRVELADGTVQRYSRIITGAETTFELPTTASRPKNVVFNDLSSVLCELDTEDYD